MAKIVLVEDETAVREMLVDELTVEGHTVYEAVNGEAGLKQIIEHTPDLIISDRAMAVMSGYQLLETIRANYPQFNNIPFVFMTALTDPRDKDAVEHLKPSAYLEKPIDFTMLHQTVNELVNGKNEK